MQLQFTIFVSIATISTQNIEELRYTFPNLSEKELNILVKLKKDNSDSDEESDIYLPWNESQDLIQNISRMMNDMDSSITIELLHAFETSSFLANTTTEVGYYY